MPEQLADIAEKALQRNPNDRFQSARAMGKALRGFIARSGAAFEAAEIAEWMRFLFNDRRKRDLRRLGEVEGVDASAVAPLPSVAERAPDGEAEAALADAPTKLAKTTSSTSKQHTFKLDEDGDDEPVVIPTRTGKWVWTALILLALAGGAAFGYWRYQPQVNAWLGIQPAEQEAAPEQEAEPEAEEELAVAIERHGAAPSAPQAQPPTAGAEVAARPSRRSAPRRSNSRRETPPPATPTPSSGRERAPVRPSTTLDFSQGPVLIRTSGGWATVTHGGRDLGRTPLRVQLPVGRQQLRLLPNGREPGRTVTVTVEWGSLTTVNVTLPGGTEGWDNPY